MEKQYMTHEEVTQLLKDGYDVERGWSQGKYQPRWHSIVYRKWRNMWKRCYDPEDKDYESYKHVIIADEFKLLSNYIKWIKSQPHFEEFCSTCHEVMWSVDKDKKGGHYFPHMMILTTQSENAKEVIDRCGGLSQDKMPVIGVSSSSILLFKKKIDARLYNFDPSHVGKCCKGKYGHKHKGYKWFYINYKHGRRLRYANH